MSAHTNTWFYRLISKKSNLLRIISIAFFILMAHALPGQNNLKQSEYNLTPLKGIVYFKEVAAELEVQSNGLNLGFNSGKILRYNLTQYYHFDLGYIADPKERSISQYLTSFEGISSFTYGKQNYFFVLRGGMGRKHFLSEKAYKRGIALGYSFEGGVNLGLLKPYYLVLEYSDELDRSFRSEAYSKDNAHLFLDVNKIRDKGKFSEGWNELKVAPGFHFNAALHFSLGAYEKYVKAMEIGVHIDTYFQKIPIMVETENRRNRFLFGHFFINFQLGQRSR
jgi:hypothetical protein